MCSSDLIKGLVEEDLLLHRAQVVAILAEVLGDLVRALPVAHRLAHEPAVEVAFLDADLTVRATRVVAEGRFVGPVRGASHVLEAAPDADLVVGERLQLVTAPSEAEPTSRAYFASAPVA